MSSVWAANTAYLATAVVLPTTFGGYTWYCTVAGTSAGVEPAWPVAGIGSDTITDGGVTWSRGTGFRQALSAAVLSLVSTFATANPGIVGSVKAVRPGNFAAVSLPCFFLGEMSESVDRPGFGPVTRTFEGFTGTLVDQLGTIEDSNARMDLAADALFELFIRNFHAASGQSGLQVTAIVDVPMNDGPIQYTALEFRFGETKITEGRG